MKTFSLSARMLCLLLATSSLIPACSKHDPEPAPEPEPEVYVLTAPAYELTKAEIDAGNLTQNEGQVNYDIYLTYGDIYKFHIELSGTKHDGEVVDLTQPEEDAAGWYWYVEGIYRAKELFEHYGRKSNPNVMAPGSTLYIKRLSEDSLDFEIRFKFVYKDGDGIVQPALEGSYKGTLKEID